ncbi:hypothetical protein MMC13_002348 [Lambiella insularis]|nr:hypothetical protein [Lambiella insularis]
MALESYRSTFNVTSVHAVGDSVGHLQACKYNAHGSFTIFGDVGEGNDSESKSGNKCPSYFLLRTQQVSDGFNNNTGLQSSFDLYHKLKSDPGNNATALSLSSLDKTTVSRSDHRSTVFKSFEDEEQFVRTIQVCATNGSNWQPGRATFDTGSVHIWISKTYLTERLGVRLESLLEGPKQSSITFTGALVSSIGHVQLIWYGDRVQSRKSCITSFHVYNDEPHTFDLLIGSKTITKEKILAWDVGAVWGLITTPLRKGLSLIVLLLSRLLKTFLEKRVEMHERCNQVEIQNQPLIIESKKFRFEARERRERARLAKLQHASNSSNLPQQLVGAKLPSIQGQAGQRLVEDQPLTPTARSPTRRTSFSRRPRSQPQSSTREIAADSQADRTSPSLTMSTLPGTVVELPSIRQQEHDPRQTPELEATTLENTVPNNLRMEQESSIRNEGFIDPQRESSRPISNANMSIEHAVLSEALPARTTDPHQNHAIASTAKGPTTQTKKPHGFKRIWQRLTK